MKHVRTVSLLTAGIATFALTACGAKAEQPAEAAKPSVTQPASPTTADGHTSPGMRLKFGERALVPVDYNKESFGTVALTVTAIAEGKVADLKGFEPDQIAGVTPYNLRYTVEFVKGDDLSGFGLALRGLLSDGKQGGTALVGKTADCGKVTAPRDGGFSKPGQKFEACTMYGAKGGEKVSFAAFNTGDAYRKTPIVWGD
ncbi:hypothetical protein DMH03_23530 [Amycolatopsis sp. WAC 01376]|uniref:hypothetical protein n=1 Tax=Amycolatopsis sp. WAC 01376 TaxID=2203195 RepID=UPI000F78B463|nr:hypothetical protein [Amycolatopsis sp. WAC 01376]RSM58878.1 hypothetical protein DMH03_23530 [Amycolatopsis sp. WAC 01376]